MGRNKRVALDLPLKVPFGRGKPFELVNEFPGLEDKSSILQFSLEENIFASEIEGDLETSLIGVGIRF
jgi:hypothetical protein